MAQHFLSKLTKDTIKLIGFPELDKETSVTFRIHNNRLIINFGKVLTGMLQTVVVLYDNCTQDERVIRLVNQCCPNKNTAFYRPLKGKAEYYQAKDIILPDEHSIG